MVLISLHLSQQQELSMYKRKHRQSIGAPPSTVKATARRSSVVPPAPVAETPSIRPSHSARLSAVAESAARPDVRPRRISFAGSSADPAKKAPAGPSLYSGARQPGSILRSTTARIESSLHEKENSMPPSTLATRTLAELPTVPGAPVTRKSARARISMPA